ncbi:hypothetical protein CGCA056_v002299 [Colletotrichum aenigma]|uniref:uncharacterized protein n=1 Tax=Colletotrichum aenigma TaxID=1215731 RepID=UPI001872672D|nr:uncharacterized protein CGCA056_v002299 [Colletotrichum aenigma]KAF5525429.1 hypothetical protein CGCA056_v002299 [Colletotrichum aenigma]
MPLLAPSPQMVLVARMARYARAPGLVTAAHLQASVAAPAIIVEQVVKLRSALVMLALAAFPPTDLVVKMGKHAKGQHSATVAVPRAIVAAQAITVAQVARPRLVSATVVPEAFPRMGLAGRTARPARDQLSVIVAAHLGTVEAPVTTVEQAARARSVHATLARAQYLLMELVVRMEEFVRDQLTETAALLAATVASRLITAVRAASLHLGHAVVVQRPSQPTVPAQQTARRVRARPLAIAVVLRTTAARRLLIADLDGKLLPMT